MKSKAKVSEPKVVAFEVKKAPQTEKPSVSESGQNYIHDCNTLSPSKLAKKYLLTHTSWRATKHRAKKLGIAFDSKLEDFANFIRLLGPRPSAKHTLDRIDHAGAYAVENTRWADKKTQSQNRSNTIRISYRGKTFSAHEFAQELGVSVDAVYRGVREGRSAEEIASRVHETSANKTVREPWPWPHGKEAAWERAYREEGEEQESRERFYFRTCKQHLEEVNRALRPYHENDCVDSIPEELTARYEHARQRFADARQKYQDAIARREKHRADLF